ncbi:MAG: PAS domain S-box protein [Deltaproteobacteria bacterium]|nr:PAS domain S-box protein [Deltaproteobacteria bacterium]
MEASALNLMSRNVLAEESALLSYAVEHMGEAVVITDADGNIEYVNGAFETATGYRRDEVCGKNTHFLRSDRHDRAFFDEISEALRRGEVWKGRIFNRRKDGTTHETDTTITPFRDSSGRTIHHVAIARDLTRDLKLDERMQQASRMDAIGQLSGGIAHDFNNLLSVIINYIGFVSREIPATLPLQQDIAEIQKAAFRAAALSRQLLVFSRQRTVALEIIDVDEAIRAIVNLLRRTVGANIELRHDPAPELWRTKADRGQLEQILVNLIINARDAMPNGGSVVLSTTNVALDHEFARRHPGVAPGHYVRLTVTDTGCGMAPDVSARAFEPFFTTKATGTGLGLATVFGIVKGFGGNISIDSEPAKGTSIEINLPAVPDLAPMATATGTESASAPGRGETVLVAEDHDAVRTIACRILESNGYKTIAATDGVDALTASDAHHGPIDLLITDLVMPLLSGRELALRLRERRPQIKILLMSSYREKDMPRGQATIALLDFMMKPFTESELLRRVRELLDRPASDTIIERPKKT